MLALWSGLAAGGLHAVSGPDHLAALGPLALRAPRHGGWVGASWGAGHGTGLLLLVALVYGARLALPLAAFAWAAELGVGLLLTTMGLMGLRPRPPTGVLSHGGRAAFGVGVLHGATGAGHLAGLLPVLGLGRIEALAYVASYAFAAAFAMGLFGLVLGNVALRSEFSLLERMRRTMSAVAILVGTLWIVRTLFA